jgi:hypothetical protein
LDTTPCGIVFVTTAASFTKIPPGETGWAKLGADFPVKNPYNKRIKRRKITRNWG